MRVGIVTKWFNRGQAFVSRYIRDALEEAGHETFILARPTRDKGPMAAHVDRTGVWDQPGVTEASDWEVPMEEYERWIADNGIEVVHWDNCYQHEEIARLRSQGVKTVGRFVWEMFSPEDAEPAKRAYDVLYSMTRCEQERYATFGIDSPYVQWGLHKELLEAAADARAAAPRDRDELVRFYFPGALLGPRKPHKEVVEAFRAAEGDNLRLIFKAQLERRMKYLEKAAAEDPRIELVIDDMETTEHLRLFAGCDVCLGPSRWEGLGLFLYEAVAFEMPQITNDSPPMNEVVRDGVNGILIPDVHDDDAPSGIPSMRPDVPAMTAAIERLADPAERARLGDGARASREELSWDRTVADYASLVEKGGLVVKLRREILNRTAGWNSRRLAVKRAKTAPPPAPFVVGATRSGTTLLRLMLDAHPQLAIPSETHFIPELVAARDKHNASRAQMLELMTSHRRWGDFQLEPEELDAAWAELDPLTGPAAVRAFFHLYARKLGKPDAHWGDKTPGYVKSMREIQVYLPEARFIHLIRDGRDVALSVLKQDWGPQSIEAAAEKWRSRVLRGRAQQPYLGFYMEVKFEDLVLHTERELRRICEFVELDFEPAMLGYHETAEKRLQEKARALPRAHGAPQAAEKRLQSHAKTFEPPNPNLIGTWKQKMAPEDRASYESLAGDLLADLGYELDQPDTGEVHTPKRRIRLPRPMRRVANVAAHATGIREPAERRDPAPFLIGASRSGTSLLRAMLGVHPDLAIVSETGFAPQLAEMIRSEPMTVERTLKVMAAAGPLEKHGVSEEEMRRRLDALEGLKAAAVLRAFYEAAAEAAGKPRWGDETPSYLKRERRLQRALFEARFIHVIRDGRDTLAAKPGDIDVGSALATGQRWEKKVRSARQQEHLMEHYVEVRYEDLIADPEGTLRGLCELLELEFDPVMVDPPERAEIEAGLGAVGGWRERLTPEQLAAFEEPAAEMLIELGYGTAAPQPA